MGRLYLTEFENQDHIDYIMCRACATPISLHQNFFFTHRHRGFGLLCTKLINMYHQEGRTSLICVKCGANLGFSYKGYEQFDHRKQMKTLLVELNIDKVLVKRATGEIEAVPHPPGLLHQN